MHWRDSERWERIIYTVVAILAGYGFFWLVSSFYDTVLDGLRRLLLL